MAESLGSLCIVLHGHLPYVLNHGVYPHGETWLYEAAAETYLPILSLLEDAAANGIRTGLTIGLTPVLLEQLAHPRFKENFVAYLHERADRAGNDRADFGALATRWEKWYADTLAHFERIGRDLPAAFAARWHAGQVELLTSNATHAYMPLLLNDQMLSAQMTCGVKTSERHLGKRPGGMWLPECAYRPMEELWKPAVLYDDPRSRPGIESIVAAAGVTHFFVDTHLITEGTPIGTMETFAGKTSFRAVGDAQLHWDHETRGWHNVLDPVGVVSSPHAASCFAFARHPRVSQQVWSGKLGYPGAGEYLEFHRKHGEHGLRYHRVTDNALPLSEKQPYQPETIASRVYEQAQHFCWMIRETLSEFKKKTGRTGTVVAPFDAELFGHWWFEGPRFLRDVLFTLANDPQVTLATSQDVLKAHPPEKVMRLPEGSWGEHGNHSVWLNDQTRWMWEIEYRAEGRFLKLLHELPWRSNVKVRRMMERAARELMLLQASDWPFIAHAKVAQDYGIQRFSGHATRFDRMMTIAQLLASGGKLGEIEKVQVAEVDLHDDVFGEIQLEWWA